VSALEQLSSLSAVVVPVLLVSAIGYAWCRLRLPFDHHFITDLITNVAAPFLAFSTFSQVHLDGGKLAVMGLASLACLGFFALCSVVGLRLARLPLRVYLPSLVFPNIGNIGLPVCLFAFGETGLALAMVYFAICTVLQFTVGRAIAAGRLQLGEVLRVPFVYAVVLALIVSECGLTIPAWLSNTTAMVGATAVPLMLLALGVALGELRVNHLRRALVLSLARLLIGLAGGAAIAALLGLEGMERGVVMIQSAMPVAVFNYLFARVYGNEPDEVAGMVVVSTTLSYLSLPLVVWLALPRP